MIKKKIIITDCLNCPWFSSRGPTWCEYSSKIIDFYETKSEIPEWCELEEEKD